MGRPYTHVSDNYCTVGYAQGTYDSANLGALTLTVSVKFGGGVYGTNTVYNIVYDTMGNNTSWGQAGTIAIPQLPVSLTANGVFVTSAYLAVLGRAPSVYQDDAMWLAWVNGLTLGTMTRDQVINSLLTSAEYRSKYYVNGNAPDNTAFLTTLYRNAIQRQPTTAELNGYLSQLSSGQTRSQVVATVMNLPEFAAVNSYWINNSGMPQTTPPIVLGGYDNTTGYRPLFTGLPQYTYITVSDPALYGTNVQSGYVWFVSTDASGNITQQCPVNFTVATRVVQVESTGQSSSTISCTVSNGAITGYGTENVSFYVTFSDTGAGNYTILANATDANGIESPWTTLGTWSMSTPNTNPTPTFTLSIDPAQTFPINLLAIPPNGGPVVTLAVDVTGYNNFNCPVSFGSLTNGILASGSGGPGRATVNLQATVGGITSFTLLGSSGNCGAGPAQGAQLAVPLTAAPPPQTVTQTITSNPLGQGLTVTVDGSSCPTPCALQWVSGSTHSISVPTTETGATGAHFTYAAWSDSGTQTHNIIVGTSPATITASFTSPPNVTIQQPTSQTIPSGGAASFQVYIGQFSPTLTANLSVTNYTGGSATVNPSSITGSGWATVILNGPSTTSFTVVASSSSGTGSTQGSVTVSQSMPLQPDFTTSTPQSSVTLSPSVPTTILITVGAVGGGTGTLTFSSPPGALVSVSGSSSQGVASVTLTGSAAPAAFIVIGTDSAGHQHQFYANCQGGGSAIPGTSGNANSISGLVAVPYDGSPRQFTFGIVGLTADLLQALGTSTSSCKFPSTQQLQGLQAQVSGSFPDPIYGLAVNFTISYDPSPPPNGPVTVYNPVCTIAVAGAVLAVALGTIEAYQPGCTPSISSIQVNGQDNNTVIAGTKGSMTINGKCLTAVSTAWTDAGNGNAPISVLLQATGNSDTSMPATYTATACQPGQTCPTTGQHTLTVAAQVANGQTVNSPPAPLTGTDIHITKLDYTGFIPYYKDCSVNSPGLGDSSSSGLLAISSGTEFWRPAACPSGYPGCATHPIKNQITCSDPTPQNEAVAYATGSTVTAVVEVTATNAPTLGDLKFWVEGSPTSVVNLPTLVSANLNSQNQVSSFIPFTLAQGTTQISSKVAGASTLPNQTSYSPDLITKWYVASYFAPQPGAPQPPVPDLNTCTSNAACPSIDNSQNTLYVLLNSPGNQTQKALNNASTRTAIQLATKSNSPSVDLPSAFANTWSQFNTRTVQGWDGRELYFYNSATGQGLHQCNYETGGFLASHPLLTQQNVGDSCLWSLLFLEALAINGISTDAGNGGLHATYGNLQSHAHLTGACATDGSNMLFNNWTFNVTGTSNDPIYPFSFLLFYENTDTDNPYGMVPLGGIGEVTSEPGAPGQNTLTPSEKALGTHHIVMADSTLTSGTGYFDPSYALRYSQPSDLEGALIAGYWAHPGPDPSTQTVVARPRARGTTNITFGYSFPSPVTLVAPVNNATGQSLTPTLTWTPTPGARLYMVNIGNLPTVTLNGEAIVPTLVNNQSVVTYPIPTNKLTSGTTYTWSVDAVDCSTTVASSNPSSFTTQ